MYKSNVVNPHRGILFGNKKERSTHTGFMDEPGTHYAKEEEPAVEDHAFYDFLHMKDPKLANI